MSGPADFGEAREKPRGPPHWAQCALPSRFTFGEAVLTAVWLPRTPRAYGEWLASHGDDMYSLERVLIALYGYSALMLRGVERYEKLAKPFSSIEEFNQRFPSIYEEADVDAILEDP